MPEPRCTCEYMGPHPEVTPGILAGRCASGAQGGRGRRVHGLLDGLTLFGAAMCGAEPGRQSGGWSKPIDPTITCPRCRRKVATRCALAPP